MNYLIYFVLTLLLTCTVGPASIGMADSERAQKLFNILKSRMTECSKEGISHPFYTCPSHFWPEILQNFVPMVKDLGKWIRQRIGTDDAIWFHLAGYLGDMIVECNMRELGEIEEEVKAWVLLNHYLKLDESAKGIACGCLRTTLDSLTGMDLQRVARLPYHGGKDLFDDINELVDDPRKARLLDGLKRASRNDFEMSQIIVSLRRWLGRSFADHKETVSAVESDKDVRSITVDQARTKTMRVPNFEGDKDLTKLFELIFKDSIFKRLRRNQKLLQDSIPQSFSNRDHLINFLIKFDNNVRVDKKCQWAIEDALKDFRVSTDWDKVVSYNTCVMTELSKLPDEFFEDFRSLGKDGWVMLDEMLQEANLPVLNLQLTLKVVLINYSNSVQIVHLRYMSYSSRDGCNNSR